MNLGIVERITSITAQVLTTVFFVLGLWHDHVPTMLLGLFFGILYLGMLVSYKAEEVIDKLGATHKQGDAGPEAELRAWREKFTNLTYSSGDIVER